MTEHVRGLEAADPSVPGNRVRSGRTDVHRARRSPWFLAAGGPVLVTMTMALAACGGGTQAVAPTSSAPATAIGWLQSVAEPLNHKLNKDQLEVLNDSKADKGEASSTYFDRLERACTQMLDHARQAGKISHAPSAALDAAWHRMAVETQRYASECVAVARDPSQTALTMWTATLAAMDSANGAFNAAVKPLHPSATPDPVTSTSAAG